MHCSCTLNIPDCWGTDASISVQFLEKHTDDQGNT